MATKMLILAVFMLTQCGKAALVVQKEAIALEDGDEFTPKGHLPTTAPMWANNIPEAPPLKDAELGDMPQPPQRFGEPGAWWKSTQSAENRITPVKAKNTQITVIVNMIQKVKYDSQMDLYRAGKAYDQSACRCQDQIASAMESLGENKEILAKHRDLVKKYAAEIGALTASTKQLAKDIKGLKKELKDNEDTRATELPAFNKAKFNLEENIRSMGEAIAIVTPPAADASAHPYSQPGSFLSISTIRDKMMSVVSQIKPIVSAGTFPSNMQAEDVEVLKSFLAAPGKYVSGGNGTSALQVDNPHGNFGNPSAQIDGIMKAMLDGFQADNKTAHDDEAASIRAYESLKLVKSQEKFTFEQELERASGALADKTKDMSTSKTLLDDTAKADASDKKFFETTTAACKEKAQMWSISNRMRTEEIAGLDRAVYQLGGEYSVPPYAKVQAAVLAPPPPPPVSGLFIQVQDSGMNKQQERTDLQLKEALMKVFSKLRSLALKSHSVGIALVALEAKASQSGVFDKLLPKIDDMITVLRKEEQDDIKKRDYCENTLHDIFNDKADKDTDIIQTHTTIGRIDAKGLELDGYIAQVTEHIKRSKQVIGMEIDQRKKEHQLFKDDSADKLRAQGMMNLAIDELEKVYKNNLAERRPRSKEISLAERTLQKDALVERRPRLLLIQAPGAAPGAKPARRLQGKGESHSGQREETNTIVDMLTMLQQDIENELKEDKVEDDENQKSHDKKVDGLNEKIRTQDALRTEALKDKASGDARKADLEALKESLNQDIAAANTKKQGVDAECAHILVSNGFNIRRGNRKVEMQGLSDAKDVLAGGLPTV